MIEAGSQRNKSLPQGEPAWLDFIPHRDPFLFIDEVLELEPRRIVTRKVARAEADFFRGHYPGEPVMPGVLLCECCFQAGALLIANSIGEARAAQGIPVLTRITDARFKHIVRPGDDLKAEVTLDEELDAAYFLTGRLSANDRHALRVTFACMLAPRLESSR
jgi:3-hydroxyacyl-[acyl-carrier-protein] dehydratase